MKTHPYLEDRIVKVVPIPSGSKWNGLLSNPELLKKQPFSFPDTAKSFDVPLSPHGGITVILDNITEKECPDVKGEDGKPAKLTQMGYFEYIFGVDMNPYLPDDKNFWKTHKDRKVTVTAEGLSLDLKDPKAMFKYLILLSNNKRIARSMEEFETRKYGTYQLVITDEASEVNREIQAFELDLRAKEIFGIIIKDNIGLDFLRVAGIRASQKSTPDQIKSGLIKLIEGNKSKFIEIYEDPNFKIKSFIYKAINIGEIIQKGNKYELATGTVLGDINDAVGFFKNPENVEVKERIKDKISQAV
jgi:hypothetical protein